MWELDCEEGWAPKNWCFWTVVLEKTLESPLDCKEIQPVHPKGNQSWIFIGRTDAKAEAPILCPPGAKRWLIRKDPDGGKDWEQEEKGTTEDETVERHHWLNGHGFGWTPGVDDGLGGLACCGSWGRKELDMTEWLNWTEGNLVGLARQCIKKQRHYFANKGLSSQNYGFSCSHVWMWELDYKENWAPKNWCFCSVVLEKTLESPLDCREIQPVHPKWNQSWIFIGGTDAEAETPILWPPDVKNWFIGKDPDGGKDWEQEEKGTTEDEMVGWHHRLDGREFEQTLGVGDGQGNLAWCSPWGCKESDTTERLNWTELNCSNSFTKSALCPVKKQILS